MKLCNDRKGADKALHFIVSLAIGALLAGLLSMARFLGPWWAAVITFLAVMAVGIAKEVRDVRQSGNHFCVWDLLCDAAGALVAAIVAWLANYYTWH